MDPDILAMLMGGMGGGMPTAIPPVPAMPSPELIGSSMNPASPAYPTLNPSPVMAPPQEPYRSEPMGGGAPTLGQSLEPVPVPRPRPTDLSSSGPTDVGSATSMTKSAGAEPGSALLKTLQSVKAPAPPVPQKVSTPHAPALTHIQGGGFADLLASLGIGPQQALPGLKLPSTLGQALGGR